MTRARDRLIIALGVAVTVRVLWWVIVDVLDALIPILLFLVLLVTFGSALYYRYRRWW